MRRDPTPKLVRYLSFGGYVAMLLMPIQAAGQQPNFQIKPDVRVREDSFACKEIYSIACCRLINAADLPQEHICMYNVIIASDSLKGARVCTRTRDNMFASTRCC